MTGEADRALTELWTKYRGWSKRARSTREELDGWRKRMLGLTCAGAILGTLAAQIAGGSVANADWLGKILSGASAVAMAMAAFAGKSFLDKETEGRWLRSRSLAESCKSAGFLYASRTPPYDGADAGQKLVRWLEELLASAGDIPAMEVDRAEVEKTLPPCPLGIQDYRKLRVEDQVSWYRGKAAEYEHQANLAGRAVQLLGAVAALLGALGALGYATQLAAWVATLGTLAAAVGAFALGQRFQTLSSTYRITSDRLALRLALWEIAPVADDQRLAADRALVTDCEAVMAAENQAWLAEFRKEVKPT